MQKTEFSTELLAAVNSVIEINSRREALEAAVSAMPATIEALRQRVQELTENLGSIEAELALCPPGAAAKRLERDSETRTAELAVAENEVKRAIAKLSALESKIAPEVDAAMAEAALTLHREIGIDTRERKKQIADELRHAVKPLLEVLAKAKAVDVAYQFNDLFQVSFVPDYENFVFLGASSQELHSGFNLLNALPDSEEARQVTLEFAPLRNARRIVTAYKEYVPLAKRPGPYQIKGTSEGEGRASPEPFSRADYAKQQIAGRLAREA